MSKIHHLIMDKVSDADLHSKMEGVPYSTNLRAIVAVCDMEEYYLWEDDENG